MTLEKPLAFDQIPPEVTERGVGRLAGGELFLLQQLGWEEWGGMSGRSEQQLHRRVLLSRTQHL
jgi:hypothetical protein